MNNFQKLSIFIKHAPHSSIRSIPVLVSHIQSAANHTKVKMSTLPLMKTWQIENYGDVDTVALCDVQKPILHHPDEILVKVTASSVNPIDILMLGGYAKTIVGTLRTGAKMPWGYLPYKDQRLPLTVGRDFCGQVIGVGKSVKKVSVGQRVFGIVDFTRQGCHSEYTVTDASKICPIDDAVSDIDAASLPYAALTGWSAITVSAGLTRRNAADKCVLILGTSGGVGSFISQLLVQWGAEVVGVCSEESMERARSYGVQELYDYRDPETEKILTSTPRFDVIIDAANQTDEKWMKGLRSGVGASFVTLRGPLVKNIDDNGLLLGLGKSAKDIICANWSHFMESKRYKWAYFMPNEAALTEMASLMASGKVKSCVDTVYPFNQIKEAYKHQATNKVKGKIVIQH